MTHDPRHVVSRTACCLLMALCCLAASPANAADRGTGLVWLREALGPRSAGMGAVSVALTGDQVSAGDNPGALAALRGPDVLIVHQELFAGIRQEYAGAAFGNGRRGVGFGFAVRTSGGIERRVGPSAEPLGTFSVYDADFSVRYAQRIAGVSAGVGLRVLHETVEADGASGVAVDLGGIAPLPVPHMSLGAALRHLGRMRGPGGSTVRLPLTFQTGVVYETSIASDQGRLLITAEISFPRGGESALRTGGEVVWSRLLAIRVGYEAGRDSRGAAFGLGILRRGWRLDYAMTPYRNGLGNAHRVSIGFR